ncbi:MAG: adenylate/guanylate cyclase domain-containing protein [Patescibacteria group bacterium]
MPKNKRQRILVPLLLILANAFLWSVFYFFGIFGGWQITLQDKIYSTENRASADIVIVAIDDASLSEQGLGRWQDWSRENFAVALDNLNTAGAAAIGIDVIFSEPSKGSADKDLSAALRRNTQTVLAAQKNPTENLLPLPELRESATVGFTNLAVDASDGVVRRVQISEDGILNFDIALLEKYFGIKPESINSKTLLFSDKKLRPAGSLDKSYGPISAPLENGTLLINFFGRPGSFTQIPFVDVFRNNFVPESVRGKIVLIGVAGATGIHDEQLTPVSAGEAMSGVEIHANILQTLLSGETLQNFDGSFALALIVLTLVIFGILFFSTSLTATFLIFLTALFAEIISAILAFSNGILLPFGFNIVGTFSILIIALAYRYFSEGADLRYLQQAFSRYLAPELVRKIENDPAALGLRGAKRELTIFFSDFENFTKISEKMSPGELVRLLDDRLGAITKVILAAGGTLDKFIGDAVMAFWNAPLKNSAHALSACRAALAAQKILAGKNPRLRIGIHTGPAIVGNIGLSMRFNYTAVGDSVNLASRLEGVNKVYGTQILISGETFKKIKNDFLARKIDCVAVKGRREFTEIYELLAEQKTATRAQIELAKKSAEAFAAYSKRDFKKAIKIYREIHNPASKVLIDKISVFIKKPPPKNWRGETVLKNK